MIKRSRMQRSRKGSALRVNGNNSAPILRTVGSTLPIIILNIIGMQQASAAPFAYISNSGQASLSVYDVATGANVATIPVGSNPTGVALSPSGEHTYVTNLFSDTISVIDARANNIVSSITVGDGPSSVAITPDGSRMYVTNQYEDTVSVIDTQTRAIVATIAVGDYPQAVAVKPGGEYVYVSNQRTDSISVISVASNTVIATITAGNAPYGIAFSPDGSRAYVANRESQSVTVINSANHAAIGAIDIGGFSWHIAIMPDGSHAYVTQSLNDQVSVIDLSSQTKIDTITVGDYPLGIDITPSGHSVYVTNNSSHSLSVIDTTIRAVAATISTGAGSYPYSLGNFIGSFNQPPELAPIPAKNVDEGETLTFVVEASDPDGDTVRYSASNLPPSASFDSVTGLFTWTPDYGAQGSYEVIFTATDDGSPMESDQLSVSITVGDVNRPPVIVLPYPNLIQVEEGEVITFNVSAEDPDANDSVSITGGGLPPNASFDGSNGEFIWHTGYADAGNYTIWFTATDNGIPILSDSGAVTLTVGNVNRQPVIDLIGNKSVDEGAEISFVVTASDPDGDAVTLSVSNLPIGAEFDETTQTFFWAPDFGDAGNYTVVFSVTDNGAPNLTSLEEVTITVGNVNRAPELSPIGARSIDENNELIFTVAANDADGDVLSYSASGLPNGATFDEVTQRFSWLPGYDDSGSYNVTFTVSDDGTPTLTDQEIVAISVGDVNRPPVLSSIGPKSVDENQPLDFVLNASDLDGNSLQYSVSNLPSGAIFDYTSRTFSWTPGYGDAGSYDVTFIVADDGTPPLSDQETVTVSVGNVNRPPVINAVGDQSVLEGESLMVTVAGTDPDGDALTFSASNLPVGASFDPVAQRFEWTPDFNASGEYGVLFNVTDDGVPVLNDQEVITITVGNVNRSPVLDPIGNRSVLEGELLQFTVTANDLDGDALDFSAANLPSGANFDVLNQIFTWTPGFNDAGNYADVEFTVTDDGDPVGLDVETIVVTVGDMNRAPMLDPVGARSVLVGEQLTFTVTASDPDGDNIALSTGPLPLGASFNNTTGVFDWLPDGAQAGTYTIVVFAQDDGSPNLTDNIEITVTVGTNLTPRQKVKSIIDSVKSLGLPKATRRSLLKPLRKARKRIGRNKVAKAIVSLERFIIRVNNASQSGLIDSTAAVELVDAANIVISDLQP